MDVNASDNAHIFTFDGGGSERVGIYTSDTHLLANMFVSGSTVFSTILDDLNDLPNRCRIGIKYSQGDFLFYINGSLISTQSYTEMPAATQLSIGQRIGGTKYSGDYGEILYFATDLTHVQMISLTRNS